MVEQVERRKTVTPAEARAALKDVLERGELDERGRESVAVLCALLESLKDQREDLARWESLCPGCERVKVSPAYAHEHLATCPGHPARARLALLREALRLAPGIAGALGIEVRPPEVALDAVEAALAATKEGRHRAFVPTDGLRLVTFLVEGGRAKSPGLVEDYARRLEEAVALWERVIHRDTDPCRFCGTITPLREASAHALHCKRHPALTAAAPLEEALRAWLGKEGMRVLIDQLSEREAHLSALAALVDACEEFNFDLGRGAGGYRASDEAEKALYAARDLAGQAIRLVAPRRPTSFDPIEGAASGPGFARPVWKALLRVTENAPTPGMHRGTEVDAALLCEAARELTMHEGEFGPTLTCPACRRPGLPLHESAAHIAACPGHPAILREREAEASLVLAAAIRGEVGPGKMLGSVRMGKAPHFGRFSPTTRDEADGGPPGELYGLRQLDFLVDPAQRCKHPDLASSYAADVARLLAHWQDLRGAKEAECPYCETGSRFPSLAAHLVECAGHPALGRARDHEERLAELGAERLSSPGQLRHEAELARIAIARLVEYIHAFGQCFGDDERGRAIISRSRMPKWEREIQLAKETLQALRSSAHHPEA